MSEHVDQIPLNCPYCGRRLGMRRDETERRVVYECPVHGQFWIDDSGQLGDVPRA